MFSTDGIFMWNHYVTFLIVYKNIDKVSAKIVSKKCKMVLVLLRNIRIEWTFFFLRNQLDISANYVDEKHTIYTMKSFMIVETLHTSKT